MSSRKQIYRGEVVDLGLETVNLPDRETMQLEVVRHPGGAAVRDNETGLVWERSPSTSEFPWYFAILTCVQLRVDDRKGWSLPMLEQLASLVDEDSIEEDGNGDPLKLPSGHPFDPHGVQSGGYWSATTFAEDPSAAGNVRFNSGSVTNSGKGGDLRAWCVRGGQVYDGQDVQEVIDELLP